MSWYASLKAKVCGFLMPTWLKHLITERDNQTPDPKRLIALGLAVEYLYLPLHSVIFNHSPMDFNSFALGGSALIVSVGVALGIGAQGERPA